MTLLNGMFEESLRGNLTGPSRGKEEGVGRAGKMNGKGRTETKTTVLTWR